MAPGGNILPNIPNGYRHGDTLLKIHLEAIYMQVNCVFCDTDILHFIACMPTEASAVPNEAGKTYKYY